MDALTLAAAAVLIAVILVAGYLMAKDMANKHHMSLKELEAKMPPPPPAPPAPMRPPLSDTAMAIEALHIQLGRLQDEYENNQDSDVLDEIGKINATLAKIATASSGTMCKCGSKKP